MRTRSITGTAAIFVSLFCAAVFAVGCSFNPLKYMSRNACDVLNCDVLFFVEDLLPLSARPTLGGDAAPADEGGGGGGH